ncbi:tRNA1(Val) (adenine(37)-N6)-methyltransferase [Gelidibacter salicanalis]|uniref:tRNA1(Val) (adenine(37)-N6)-methyltransferase n=1 Tax=Gelidibacter salicanalis TaxID=291193 RepID=A0A934KSV0_9FLAO|nr:methyltransferase [Gelidibacter salicanalis]MBJ7880107.1 methyltransferase [Gelidibacter salicanalis]
MKPFQFKQFTVYQNRCAMKIGTDSVLLGAWASLDANPYSILDIGAGTGVLALMMAQRSAAELIDAIEIDDAAYVQCVDNFEQSPWADRLFCYHAALDEFVEDLSDDESGMDDSYDLIISNPPFYTDTYKSDNQQRDLARFADAMPFRHLIESVSKLLSKQGLFSVIIPFSEEKDFMVLASKEHLYPQRILRVKGTPESEIKRSLIEFSFQETTVNPKELVIETARHQYTEDYIALTKDFYLKM